MAIVLDCMKVGRKIGGEMANVILFALLPRGLRGTRLAAVVTAAQSQEQGGRPYPKYLKVTKDYYTCWGQGCTEVVQRNIEYELYDSNNERLSFGVVTEHLYATDYDEPVITLPGHPPNTSSGPATGTFSDEISIQFGYPRSYLQTFTARDPSQGLVGFFGNPVYVVGFGGEYAILNYHQDRHVRWYQWQQGKSNKMQLRLSVIACLAAYLFSVKPSAATEKYEIASTAKRIIVGRLVNAQQIPFERGWDIKGNVIVQEVLFGDVEVGRKIPYRFRCSCCVKSPAPNLGATVMRVGVWFLLPADSNMWTSAGSCSDPGWRPIEERQAFADFLKKRKKP
jgi:hypothetical protein